MLNRQKENVRLPHLPTDNVDQLNSDGQPALTIAMLYGHLDMFEELLELGADPNIAFKAGQAPIFHAAAKFGNLEAGRILVTSAD